MAADQRLLRQVAAVANQLPAVDHEELEGAFMEEYNDALMVGFLASVTKSTSGLTDLTEKFGHLSQTKHRF